jgi:DDE superfamily endonuclease
MILTALFAPAVWYVVIDDTERISTRAPGSLIHHNHTAKPNRPRFLRGWLCLAAVVERDWRVGAVPLMLRLVRRGANRGKLKSARFLLRLLGNRLGRVLLDAWFMRGRLILATVAEGHPVIGRVRRDLALYTVPRPPRRTRGRPRKYGERFTRGPIEALPLQRSAQILYGNLEVVRYRTALGSARFLKGRVRAGAARTPRPPGQADRGTPADLHRSRSPGH